MLSILVSPRTTLNEPLLTVICTADVGAFPPVDVPSLDQILNVPALFVITNLK